MPPSSHQRGPQPAEPTAKSPRQRADWYKQTSAASVGIEMAVAICGCALGGMYLERHYTHWAPWTTLIGLFIGIGAAALAIARLVREHETEMAARKAESERIDVDARDDVPAICADRDAGTPARTSEQAQPDSDDESDDEAVALARLRRRQRARPLETRGPLP